MTKKKTALLLVSVLCLLLLFSGCTKQTASSEQRVTDVLTAVFTGPDEEAQAYGNVLNEHKFTLDQADSQKAVLDAEEQMQTHLKEKYSKDDFAENYYDALFKKFYTDLAFPTLCIVNEANITPVSVTVTKSATDGFYDYTAELEVTKADQTTLRVTQSGRVQTNKDGKITNIELSDSSLFNALL